MSEAVSDGCTWIRVSSFREVANIRERVISPWRWSSTEALGCICYSWSMTSKSTAPMFPFHQALCPRLVHENPAHPWWHHISGERLEPLQWSSDNTLSHKSHNVHPNTIGRRRLYCCLHMACFARYGAHHSNCVQSIWSAGFCCECVMPRHGAFSRKYHNTQSRPVPCVKRYQQRFVDWREP